MKQCAIITIQTWYIRVPSQVLELLKAYDLQKLGNVTKVTKNEHFVDTKKKLYELIRKLPNDLKRRILES